MDPSHWGVSEWVAVITGSIAVLGAVYGSMRFLLRNIWPVEDPRRREVLSALATFLVAATTGGVLLELWRRSQPVPPSAPTIAIRFTYGTEKDAWVKAAIARFHATSPRLSNGWSIRVLPDGRGSIATVDEIQRGTLDADAWCPASSVELAQLRGALESDPAHTNLSFSRDEPASLATSYLVLLSVWPERTRILRQALGKIDWDTLHQAFTLPGGWAALGGQESWGGVKFGHTKPTTSNSGLMTLITLASWYTRKAGDAIPPAASAVGDPSLQAFVWAYEDAVRQYGQSTGSFTECVLDTYAANHDLIVTYESDVLASAANRTRQIELFYPSLTMVADHPYVIFARQGDPDTALKQEAARRFRDFLLEDAQQRDARAYGFRPTSAQFPLSSAVPGFVADLAAQVEVVSPPPSDVMLSLQTAWTTRYGDPTVSPGC
jgi:hypothetical protein